MIVKETKCKRDILKILNNDDIYNRMASDDIQGRKCKVDFDLKRYIGCYINDEIIGLTIYRKFEKGSVLHFYMLPKFRKDYAREFAKESLKIRGDGDVYTITPLCYKPVVNFALKMGFEYIGNHEQLFIKDGVAYEQAITRLKQ